MSRCASGVHRGPQVLLSFGQIEREVIGERVSDQERGIEA
jgi:hypothetical protein